MKITVSAHEVLYNGRTAPTHAHINVNRSFINDDGQTVISHPPQSRNYLKRVAVTYEDGVVTIPSLTGDNRLDSTIVDPTGHVLATYTVSLHSRSGSYLTTVETLQNIKIPATPTTTTWDDLALLASAVTIPYRAEYYNREQINQLLDDLEIAPNASDVVIGKARLSLPADSLSDPIVVGDNDTRVPDDLSKHNNSLATAVADIAGLGNPERILTINNSANVSATLNIPANITLDFGNNGEIVPAAGVTVTVNKMKDAGNRQVFDISASGCEVIFGRNAVKDINIAWLCGVEHGTDATKAIDLALESCANNDGGNIYFPETRYISSGKHIIPRATFLRGSGGFINFAFGGTSITLTDPTDSYLFKIGEETYDTGLFNLTLHGLYASGVDGLLFEGDGLVSNSASGRCTLEGVVFSGFGYGYNYNSLSVGTTWQMAQVGFKDCKWIGNEVCMRQTSVNSSWAFENCNFYTGDGGWIGVFESGGIMGFKNCEFAGHAVYPYTSNGFQINGAHVAINFISCQEEGHITFLENNASDESGIINLFGCLIQSKIQLNASCVVNSIGGNYLSQVFKFGGVGTSCRITAIGDHIQERDVVTGLATDAALTEGGVNDSHIIFESSGKLFRSVHRLPAKFVSPLPLMLSSEPVAIFGNVTDGTAVNRDVIFIGRLDEDEAPLYGYFIRRSDVDGWLEIEGNQGDPFKGVRFDAPVQGVINAYNAVSWNNSTTFVTEGAARDKWESDAAALVTALNLKANLANPTFTGTINGAALTMSGAVSAASLIIGSGSSITKELKNTATLDFPSIPTNSTAELTVAVTGAVVGNVAWASPNTSIETGLVWSAYVSAADTVTIRLANPTGGDIDPTSKSWVVWVRA